MKRSSCARRREQDKHLDGFLICASRVTRVADGRHKLLSGIALVIRCDDVVDGSTKEAWRHEERMPTQAVDLVPRIAFFYSA